MTEQDQRLEHHQRCLVKIASGTPNKQNRGCTTARCLSQQGHRGDIFGSVPDVCSELENNALLTVTTDGQSKVTLSYQFETNTCVIVTAVFGPMRGKNAELSFPQYFSNLIAANDKNITKVCRFQLPFPTSTQGH